MKKKNTNLLILSSKLSLLFLVFDNSIRFFFSSDQTLYPTDFRTNDCIGEFIKRKLSSGLFWAVGAAEKKNLLTAISKQLFGVVFSTFCGQKKNFKIF